MGTHPSFESDFDCLTEKCASLLLELLLLLPDGSLSDALDSFPPRPESGWSDLPPSFSSLPSSTSPASMSPARNPTERPTALTRQFWNRSSPYLLLFKAYII